MDEHAALLEQLRKQYNAMVPSRLLKWNAPSFPWADAQRPLLEEILLKPYNPEHPPSLEYQRKFVKNAISLMEKKQVEVIDELYDHFSSLFPGAGDAQGCKSYLIHDQLHVSLRERSEIISNGTTGLVTWQAGLAFVEWAVEQGRGKDLFAGKTVLELGCGVGMLGIAICKLFSPRRFIFSDYHEDVLDTLHENLALNGLVPSSPADSTGSVCVLPLDWEAVSETIAEDVEADVVVAADIVYDSTLFDGLVDVLDLLLYKRACVAYIACTVRNPATLAHFMGRLDAIYIDVDMIKLEPGALFTYDEHTEVVILRCSHES